MNDKERLENMSPLGFDLNGNILLKSEDYHWLMEQAERVEELKKEVEKQKNRKYIKMRQRDDFMKKAQRYKQALEFYADKENYFLKQRMTSSFYTPIELDKGEKARQGLYYNPTVL